MAPAIAWVRLAEHGRKPHHGEGLGEIQEQPFGSAALVTLAIERGFIHGSLALLTESDVLGERIARASLQTPPFR